MPSREALESAEMGAMAEGYTSALREYLATGAEPALHRGYELGRRALSDQVGILALAALHHQALMAVMDGAEHPGPDGHVLSRGPEFLLEVLSPFEMTHRQFREAIVILRRLNQSLEEESRRIAHSLHDEAGQLLVSVHIALEMLAREVPASRARIRGVRDLLNEVQFQLRRLSHELRPTVLDDLGLIPALEFLAEGASGRIGIPITVVGSTGGRLDPVIEVALYRVVQEALSNVARHARARSAEIHVHREAAAVSCCVQDDGVGFDEAAVTSGREGGLGLLGIRERLASLGGVLEIVSAPGRGTELRITIPVVDDGR